MATPNKLPKLDVAENEMSGYLVEVSPVKTAQSNNTYFEGTLQVSRTDYKRFVCFDATKQNSFAMANKSPVKFTKISLMPSRRQPNQSDIKITRFSGMEIKQSLNFGFKPLQTPSDEGKLDVQRCTELPPFQKVSVMAKVVEIGQEEMKDVRGTWMKCVTVQIADHTACMPLTLWNMHIYEVEVDNFYNFEHLKTRSFNGIKSLTSAPETKITKAPNSGDIKVVDACPSAGPSFQTATGKVTQVILYKNLICANCKKNIQSSTAEKMFIRCAHCCMKQNVKNLAKSVHGKLNLELDSGVMKMNIYSSALNLFLTTEDKLHLLDDVEDLEEFLLTEESLDFQFTQHSQESTVTKVTRPRPAHFSQLRFIDPLPSSSATSTVTAPSSPEPPRSGSSSPLPPKNT